MNIISIYHYSLVVSTDTYRAIAMDHGCSTDYMIRNIIVGDRIVLCTCKMNNDLSLNSNLLHRYLPTLQ
jgi:hypothetical protein